jgi:glycosyltransferase involved in cell wall biosynthesis
MARVPTGLPPRMDRIAFLLPGRLTTIAGAAIYDRMMVESLRGLGHDVAVAELAGAHPLPDEAAIAAARAAWDALPADAVPVIDGLALASFADLALEHRHAVGLIHHPTALETGRSTESREKLRAIERALFPRLARIVVTSEETAHRLVAEFGVDAGRIAVVVPGTAPARRCNGSFGPACAILAVGMLIPRKGHDVLIRALARLFDLDWQLTIAGSGERDPVHAHSLRATAEEFGVAQRVTFAGEATGAELEALWQGADIFALATYYEGYGMAIAEALKRGLPVAVCGGGAAGALVPQDAGVVCAPGDDVALSKALRRMIFDGDLRRDMADAAWLAGHSLPDWTAQARAFAANLR